MASYQFSTPQFLTTARHLSPDLPSRWPQFLLYTQVDFEALDRPLLLRPVTLRGTLPSVRRVRPAGALPLACCPPPSPTPRHSGTGLLLQEAFSPKPSLFIVQPKTMLSAVASDSQPSVPKDNTLARSSRAMIPSPCCLSN